LPVISNSNVIEVNSVSPILQSSSDVIIPPIGLATVHDRPVVQSTFKLDADKLTDTPATNETTGFVLPPSAQPQQQGLSSDPFKVASYESPIVSSVAATSNTTSASPTHTPPAPSTVVAPPQQQQAKKVDYMWGQNVTTVPSTNRPQYAAVTSSAAGSSSSDYKLSHSYTFDPKRNIITTNFGPGGASPDYSSRQQASQIVSADRKAKPQQQISQNMYKTLSSIPSTVLPYQQKQSTVNSDGSVTNQFHRTHELTMTHLIGSNAGDADHKTTNGKETTARVVPSRQQSIIPAQSQWTIGNSAAAITLPSLPYKQEDVVPTMSTNWNGTSGNDSGYYTAHAPLQQLQPDNYSPAYYPATVNRRFQNQYRLQQQRQQREVK
jgi:hypothetical protein